ncbi:Hpt domain-containing protein [Vibrio sonorensis]|uniref:Hpt domain-containing protein n=1 Tax=Vibrio sonorensis TaxID=1004316 RepID=UPI0008DA19E6|nr:Hpt domain-containing protein [Vibrio sonorensis]
MIGNRNKFTILVAVLWLGSVLAIGGYYRTNQNVLLQIEELGNSVYEFRSTIEFDSAFRTQRSNDLALNLQLIYALRLQLEGQYQSNLFTPDISHLLYTTDRFIEQAQALLDNELALVELLDELKLTRLKYVDQPESQSRYYEVGSYVFEAMYSNESSSPQVYRALDRLFAESLNLNGEDKVDLQRVLAKTSSVLNGYAQGNYLVDKLASHSVHEQITRLEDELYGTSSFLFWLSILTSAAALACTYVITYLSELSRPTDVKPISGKKADTGQVAKSDMEPIFEPQNQKIDHAFVTPKESEPLNTENNNHYLEIDLDKMLESLNGDKESVQMLLEVFVQDHKSDVDAIRDCLSEDTELALRKAHSLKGVGGSLGAMGLREAADALEMSIKTGESNAADHLDKLSKHLDKAIREAESYLNSDSEKKALAN